MRVKMPHLLCRVVYIAEASKTPDFGCCDDGLKPGYKKNRASLKAELYSGPALLLRATDFYLAANLSARKISASGIRWGNAVIGMHVYVCASFPHICHKV